MSLLPFKPVRVQILALAALAAAVFAVTPGAHAEAKLLIDAASGKVLYADNATYPWYPASLTKLMTLYTTLSEVKAGHVTINTLLTVSPEAAAQQPTKMGLKVGTTLTIDNAIKMLMVKSANDMAVAIAEGVGGSIDGFAGLMNANAKKLGMTQSNFVNPNGLPADNHYTSARDLGILARALITEFPQYDSYWHIHSIRYGNRIIHNYNKLLDRYPGADGMKTGFICASGYNLVATATRNGHRLIAIILGAWSGAVRTQQAAQLLERGFDSAQLSWLTPSLGTVNELAPIDAQPANLHDEMCGGHRRRPPSEDNDEEPTATGDAPGNGQGFMLSSLAKGKFVLGPPVDTEPPVVVFTGPADHPDAAPVRTAVKKKKRKVKRAATASATTTETQSAAKPRPAKPLHAKTAANKKKAKPKAGSDPQ